MRERWLAPSRAGTTTSPIPQRRTASLRIALHKPPRRTSCGTKPAYRRSLFNCPAGVTGRCTRVDVHRNVEHGNPIDTLFGPILGITGQGVRATATAIAASGNATDCLRPIALPGAWVDNQAPNNEFNFYDATGNPLSGSRDAFTPPSATQTGGTTISGNFGDTRPLRSRRYDNRAHDAHHSWARRSAQPPGTGTFAENMESCSGQVVELGRHPRCPDWDHCRCYHFGAGYDLDAGSIPPVDVELWPKPNRQQLCTGMRADQPAADCRCAVRSAAIPAGTRIESARLDSSGRRLPDQQPVHHRHQHRRVFHPLRELTSVRRVLDAARSFPEIPRQDRSKRARPSSTTRHGS